MPNSTAALGHSHRPLREGLSRVLADLGFDVIQASAFGEVAEAVKERNPSLTLIECGLVEGDRSRVKQLALSQPGQPVALLGPGHQDDVGWIVESGARGYLSTELSSEELGKALRLLMAGDLILSRNIASDLSEVVVSSAGPLNSGLTSSELTVLCLIGAGRTNKEIAEELVVTEHTVKTHVRHVLEKLGLRNRQQAAACAAVKGLCIDAVVDAHEVPKRSAVGTSTDQVEGRKSHGSADQATASALRP